MIEYTEKIKEISKKLLTDGKVDVVIGYKKGSIPGINEPCIIKTPEDSDTLVWDSHCRLNLANYLTGRKDRVGIIAKGCDSRNIVTHITENRISRDQLVIIGVPCTGMIDIRKITGNIKEDPTDIIESDNTVTIHFQDSETTLCKEDILQENCTTCSRRNPVIFDELVAEPVEEPKNSKKYHEVEKIDLMTPDEKWVFFDDLLSNCTRCYACRNACPLCYCPTCFVDESTPQWVGKGNDPADIRTYHTLRAFHCAGRCTDCGACEVACPMNIKVRLLTGKLNKSCEERFGHEAGISLELRPALDTFKLDDPEEFIK